LCLVIQMLQIIMLCGKTIHNTFKIDCKTGEYNFNPNNVFSNKKFVIFEEISQVPTNLYRLVEIALEMNVKVLLVGDFAQIMPVAETSNAELFIKLLCENKYIMTKYKRGNTQLLNILNTVRERTYKSGFDNVEKGNLHFCFTKRMRNILNNREIEKAKTYYTLPKNENLPKIYNNMPLKSCVTKKDGTYLNNQRWKIKSYNSVNAILTNDEKTITVDLNDLMTDFKPGYAMTIHSSQGLTISEPYTVWLETNTAFSNDEKFRMFYTAVSRGKTLQKISVIEI